MDGVGTALQVEVADIPKIAADGRDPMQTRWGIQCVVRDKFIDGAKAGFGEMPFARWFKVAHFTSPEEIHSTDDDPNFARERQVTKTAESVERYLNEMLGGRTPFGEVDPHKTDWGIRFGFHGEEDRPKMEVISATLLPTLPEIRGLAARYQIPCPIEAACPGEDSVGFGERQSCPMCWRLWLDSACCDAFMEEVATHGRQVQVRDVGTGEIQSRVIAPTINEMESGRVLILESLRFGVAAAQATWTDVATELEKGERRGIDVYQNNIRKDLHAAKPQDAQMNQLREYAKVASANSGGGNTDLLEMLAKSQMQTNELLGKLVSQKGVNIADTSDIPTITDAYNIGDDVLVDGEAGVIAELKTGGWYAVRTETDVKTVRKDRLQKGGE